MCVCKLNICGEGIMSHIFPCSPKRGKNINHLLYEQNCIRWDTRYMFQHIHAEHYLLTGPLQR